MIDKYARELFANRALQKRRRHRLIYAAAKPQNHPFVPHSLTDALDGLVQIIIHHPIRARAADVQREAREQCVALRGVRDFRMKLHAVKAPCVMRHRCNRAVFSRCNAFKTGRQPGHKIAMTHPYGKRLTICIALFFREPAEPMRALVYMYMRMAELAALAILDFTAELRGHRLHTVANAE